jgi:hypothetical protein
MAMSQQAGGSSPVEDAAVWRGGASFPSRRKDHSPGMEA